MSQRPSSTGGSIGNSPSDASRTGSAILIGTIHLDIEAARSLETLLGRLKPAAIAVEISPFSVAYRKEHENRWQGLLNIVLGRLPEERRRHFRIELLRRQIRMPFEWETASLYASKTETACIPVDCSEISRIELPTWEDELITENNLLLATTEPDQSIDEYFARHYRQAVRILMGRSRPMNSAVQSVFDTRWSRREEILSRRLLSLSRKYGSVVYIGGWIHLLMGEGIFSLANLAKVAVKDRFLLTGRTIHRLKRSEKCLISNS